MAIEESFRRADLTWYDSIGARRKPGIAGTVGKSQIDTRHRDAFTPERPCDDAAALKKYSLEPDM